MNYDTRPSPRPISDEDREDTDEFITLEIRLPGGLDDLTRETAIFQSLSVAFEALTEGPQRRDFLELV